MLFRGSLEAESRLSRRIGVVGIGDGLFVVRPSEGFGYQTEWHITTHYLYRRFRRGHRVERATSSERGKETTFSGS
jgi:hypothetical protein